MIRNLVSLPLLVASFALAMLALVRPSSASAQPPVATCNLDFDLVLHNDCPNEQCSLNFPYLVVRKPNCMGCCLNGTATLVCDSGNSPSFNVNLCALCGGSNSMDFYCPLDPTVVAETLFVYCKTTCH